jgi:hypothetical protein
MATRQEWLLLALARRRGQSMSPVQVQKSMFLMLMEARRYLGPGFYNFVPYNYGPFDAEIYQDLERMERQGLVRRAPSSDRNWSSFSITAAGIERAQRVQADIDPAAAEFLNRVVDWVCSLSFPALVRAIYERYPAFRANSVFIG